ncbi:LOW QUALITY PROTEIN: centrosome-associated protein CEP250-like, partial [Pterocles gutturalis]
ALLRAHLDKANEVNSALKGDVRKLTADWMRAREELELKEREWRKERELYENRFRGERTRLLNLWRQVVTFRRHFVEMKTATDRDLSELKAEQMRLSGLILANSSCLSSGVQLWESARVMELSALLIQSQKQNEEKKNLKTLDDTVELLALKEELSARQDSIDFLQQQHREQEEKCRKLQQRLEQLEEECKTSSSHRQHLQSLVEALRSDCAKLEKTQEELQQQLEAAEQEAWRLRQSNAELQLKEDSAGGKMEQQQMMERARRDQELLKHSLVESELAVARERLVESHLQRDLLTQEKHELSMALEKAEQSVAELRGAQRKQSAEIADLRGAAAKMSSINEALALDKVQLNTLVLQLEQGNNVLSAKVDDLERARICEEEKLNLCERRNAELCAEKALLEQLLKQAEEQQEELQVELRALAAEKAETQEKLSQVSRQQESASSGLEQLRQESSRQGHALAKVSQEKELLVHEKAALEARLAAVERHRQGLSEQLAEARSVKETLESSLFEAQQHLFQLKVARSQLEMQLHTVTQAKEVLQGESSMDFVSGDPPAKGRWYKKRSLSAELLRSEGAGGRSLLR